MAKKVRKFSDGGRAQARFDRKVADIESDYKKAQARKTGRAAEVAKAKYEQRMADAKDDLAKWTGADRTQTRAGEAAAERNLTHTRRFGARPTPKLDVSGPTPTSSAQIAAATTKPSAGKQTFAQAFRAARQGGGSTFTWRGKSYNTKMASEAPRATPKPNVVRRNVQQAAVETAVKQAPAARADRSMAIKGNTAYDRAQAAAAKRNADATAANRAQVTGGPRFNPNRPDQMRRTNVRADELMTPEERAAAYRAKLTRTAGIGAKKGGSVKKLAKGGSVDGCAKRGKTRAPMRRK